MAHEMEPTRGQELDTPERGPIPEWYMDQGLYVPQVIVERPDWMEPRPPYNPDSQLEHAWSVCLYPLRLTALGFLWVTRYWWRSAILAFLVALAMTLYKSA